ncbi:MAG: hypothetical protein RL199_54 [Pseudomonadota bacterium]|jgi:hypothetical protein
MAAETKEQYQQRALATTQPAQTNAPTRYEFNAGGLNTLAYEPASLEEGFRMAKILVDSGLTPRGVDTPSKVFLIMAQGRELGLSTMQSLTNLYVVEGKVSLSSDLMAALVLKSPVCEYLRPVEVTDTRATYAAKRKGGIEFRYSFSWEDAAKAGLTSRQTYKNNPADMLRHRALSKTVRAVFPDVISGLYTRDEVEDIVDVTPRTTVAEVVQQSAASATQPVVVEQPAKVRRRAPAQQVAAPVVQAQPVVVEEEPVAEQQDEQEQEQVEDAAPVAGPHRNDGGEIIDPLTGEVLEGFEAGAFASVGDSTTEEALTAAQKTVSEAKAMLSPSRYSALAWTYFWARKSVLGKDAPAQYQQLRAI